MPRTHPLYAPEYRRSPRHSPLPVGRIRSVAGIIVRVKPAINRSEVSEANLSVAPARDRSQELSHLCRFNIFDPDTRASRSAC